MLFISSVVMSWCRVVGGVVVVWKLSGLLVVSMVLGVQSRYQLSRMSEIWFVVIVCVSIVWCFLMKNQSVKNNVVVSVMMMRFMGFCRNVVIRFLCLVREVVNIILLGRMMSLLKIVLSWINWCFSVGLLVLLIRQMLVRNVQMQVMKVFMFSGQSFYYGVKQVCQIFCVFGLMIL